MSPRHGDAVSTIFSCGNGKKESTPKHPAAIYVEPRRASRPKRTLTPSITDRAGVERKRCTVDHCARLHVLESGGNRTQDQPVSALHSTDGFRAHGNLTPSVDGGSLQRKCFKVGVLNFALFNMEIKGDATAAKVLFRPRRPAKPVAPGERSVDAAGTGRWRWPRGRC